MSAIILRNNIHKIYLVKSCSRLAKNFQLSQHISFITNNPKLLKQKQDMSAYYPLRGTSSNSLTIKQYESTRKYTIIWKSERLLGWYLAILIPTAFAIESKELEMVLSSVVLLHTYWGCQSVCSDYLRSSVVGKLLPIIMRLSIVFLCITSLAGAYQLIYEDVGLINMIKQFWSIRGQDYEPRKNLRKFEKPGNLFNMFSRK